MNQGLERVKGIEPSYAAWEAAVLPLNYTRRAVYSTTATVLVSARAVAKISAYSRATLRPGAGPEKLPCMDQGASGADAKQDAPAKTPSLG